MNVEVHTFGPIREAVGEKVLELSVEENATVGDALHAVERRYPALEERLVDEGGTPPEDLTLTLDGTAIQHVDGLDSDLSEGAVIRATPPIVGGSR